MISLNNKTVFITGASAGIGEACARVFADAGAKLILTARRIDRIEKLAKELNSKHNTEVLTAQMDVRDHDAVNDLIDNLPDDWKSIDILINNAGMAKGTNKIHEDNHEGWDSMIDTNIKGLLHVTRAIVPGMIDRGAGHIINLGSIAGHEPYPGGGVYCSTKHAVKAITKTLRMELVDKNIRVSTIDPGMVETEFSVVRFDGDTERARKTYEWLDPLVAEDIADAVLYAATRKPHVNINEIIIMPTQQASPFIVHKK